MPAVARCSSMLVSWGLGQGRSLALVAAAVVATAGFGACGSTSGAGGAAGGSGGGLGGAVAGGGAAGGGNAGGAAGAPNNGSGGTSVSDARPAAGGAGGAGVGAGGSGAAGGGGAGGVMSSDAPPEVAPSIDAIPGVPVASGKVIIYTHSTGFRHGSIETAAAAFRTALAAQGLQPEIVADPARISTAGLQGVRGIVMISTTGRPFGDPGTDALAAFEAFVKGGGALIGVHAASSSFYPPTSAQTRMIGGKFTTHPGGLRAATCYPEGTNPAAAKLPASFPVRDEIYLFEAYNTANQVVLRCSDVGGNERLPIAWTRSEGTGRVFYSALGHSNEDFAAQSLVFRDHLLPGTLWALGQ